MGYHLAQRCTLGGKRGVLGLAARAKVWGLWVSPMRKSPLPRQPAPCGFYSSDDLGSSDEWAGNQRIMFIGFTRGRNLYGTRGKRPVLCRWLQPTDNGTPPHPGACANAYQWYRATDSEGTGKTAISGVTAVTCSLVAGDSGKYIGLGVTPKAATGIAQVPR